MVPATARAQQWQASIGTRFGRVIPEALCKSASNNCAIESGLILEVDRNLGPWLQLSGRFSGLPTGHRLGSRYKGNEIVEQTTGVIGLRASKPGRFTPWAKLSLGYVEQVTLLHEGDYLSEKLRSGSAAAIWSLGLDHALADDKWGVRMRLIEFMKSKHRPSALRRTSVAITRTLPFFKRKQRGPLSRLAVGNV